MNLYKIIIGVSTLLYAYFILSYPPSFYNDDSLFLTKGIISFSIIDFSPHFPGYVSVVLLGKFINIFVNDAKESLFYLTTFCAIFTPFIIYLYVKKIQNEKIAFIVFCLCISSPYLNNFALSMLSDSIGFFFVFLSLYLIETKKYKLSGIVASIAFFARPSYFIFYIIGLIYLYIYKKESIKPIIIYFLLITLLLFLYIYLTNGILYLQEAKRFLFGHFYIWGQGQQTTYSWYSNIFSFANLPFLFLLFIKYDKKLILLYGFFIFYFLWIITNQNPENLRHLIPIVFIAYIFISQTLVKYKVYFYMIIVFNIFITLSFTKKESPISQITKILKAEDSIIITNRNIEILRKQDFIIADKYYKGISRYIKTNKKVITISTSKEDFKHKHIFYGRFIGERTTYVSF